MSRKQCWIAELHDFESRNIFSNVSNNWTWCGFLFFQSEWAMQIVQAGLQMLTVWAVLTVLLAHDNNVKISHLKLFFNLMWQKKKKQVEVHVESQLFVFFFRSIFTPLNRCFVLSFSVDHSRIRLQLGTNDYINASLITVEEAQRNYILTQVRWRRHCDLILVTNN